MKRADDYRSWKNWNEKTFASVDTADAVYFEAEARALGSAILGSKPAVMEIGFGNASFAQWAVSRGCSYRGSEIDPELVTLGLAKGLDVHLSDVPWPTAAFDLVVAFDVLEHIELSDLPAMLRAIRASLKKGGLFLARFPSGDSPFARHIQHGDVSHRTQIGTGIIEQLSLDADFEILQIRPPAFPIFGLGLGRALRRMAVIAVRQVVGVVLRVAFFDNQPRVISPNMVVVLRK